MATWRIFRTRLRGPHESDACFVSWVQSTPADVARVMDFYEQPAVGSDGDSPNDQRLYLWVQDKPIATPKCGVELVNWEGRNGWESEGDARRVVLALLGRAEQVEKQVAEANAQAVSPGHLIDSAVKDAKQGFAAVVETASSPWTKLAIGGGLAALGLWALARVLGR